MTHTVLIVDDSAPMRRLLQRQLREAGLQLERVFQAGDGREALQVARRHRVDLIITDLQMPGMDGLQLMRELRELDRAAAIPVLVVTASADESELREAVSQGAHAYLRKPFSIAELQDCLPLLLRTA